MKTSTFPAVRVAPELRAEVESLLEAGETLSEFVESSVRTSVARRRYRAEFLARGIQSIEDAKLTGKLVDPVATLKRLEAKLAKVNSARAMSASKNSPKRRARP